MKLCFYFRGYQISGKTIFICVGLLGIILLTLTITFHNLPVLRGLFWPNLGVSFIDLCVTVPIIAICSIVYYFYTLFWDQDQALHHTEDSGLTSVNCLTSHSSRYNQVLNGKPTTRMTFDLRGNEGNSHSQPELKKQFLEFSNFINSWLYRPGRDKSPGMGNKNSSSAQKHLQQYSDNKQHDQVRRSVRPVICKNETNGPIKERIYRRPNRANMSMRNNYFQYNSSPVSPALPKIKRSHSLVYGQHDEGPLQPSSPVFRRLPTHQPQYSFVGVLPPVHLRQRDRLVLTERNSSMVNNPITVKVAPPDLLKPKTPIFVQKEPTPLSYDPQDSCQTEAILTAIREKRKRGIREEEVVSPSPSLAQVNKRRRPNLDSSVHNGANGSIVNGELLMDSTMNTSVGLGRPPITRSRRESNSDLGRGQKRNRPESPPTSCKRNAIDMSFSSSQRWIQRQKLDRSRSQSRDGSFIMEKRVAPQNLKKLLDNKCEMDQYADSSTRGSPTPSGGTGAGDSPSRRAFPQAGAVSGVETPTPTSTPMPGSTKTTPSVSISESHDQSESIEDWAGTTAKRSTHLTGKEGSVKRRLGRAHPDSIDFTKVPQLRHGITMDDYDKDRLAELDRVKQIMSEVDQAHRVKQEKKTRLISGASTRTPTSSEVPAAKPTLESSTIPASNAASTSGIKTNTASLTTFSISSKPTATSSTSTTASILPPNINQSKQTTAVPAATIPTVGGTAVSATPLTTTTPALSQTSRVVTTIAAEVPAAAISVQAPSITSTRTTTVISASPAKPPPPYISPSASQTTATVTPFSFKPAATSTASQSTTFSFGTNTPVASAAATNMATPTKESAVTTLASVPQGGFAFGNAAVTKTLPVKTTTLNTTTFTLGSLGGTTAASVSVINSVKKTTAPNTSGFGFGTNMTASSGSNLAPSAGQSMTQAAAPLAPPSATTSASGFSAGGIFAGITPSAPNTQTTSALQPGLNTSTAAGAAFSFGQNTKPASTVSGFSFNPTTTPSNPMSFGTATTTTNGTPAFSLGTTQPAQPPATSSAMFNFGAAQTSQSFAFGQGPKAATSEATKAQPTTSASSTPFQFGNAATAPLPTPVFGKTAAKKVTESMFGTAHPAATQPSAVFGGTQSATPNNSFTFGQSASKGANPSAPSPFNFGENSNNAQTAAPFGNATGFSGAGAAPAFGTANQHTQQSNQGPGIFGSATPNTTAFGQSSTGTTPGVFGAASSKPASFGLPVPNQSVFGTTGGQTAFSSNTGFGTGSQQPSQKTGGFDFSASVSAAKPQLNFGSTPQPQSSSGFAQGGQSGMFGSGQTDGSTGTHPAPFGSPAPVNPFGTQQPNQTAMFSMGSTSGTPKPRQIRTGRRRANRK